MCRIPHNTPSRRTEKIYCRLSHKIDHLGLHSSTSLHYIKINHNAVLIDNQNYLEDYGRTFVLNVTKYHIEQYTRRHMPEEANICTHTGHC
jgi:hypothetical protein